MQELLGKGAFGSVYQVKKDTGETLFAMKELPIEVLQPSASSNGRSNGGEEQKRLIGEVQILSTLQHPNIIGYYESFTQAHNLYIVMELVEGATLLDHINSLTEKGGSMAEQRIWAIFTQICLALRYVHKEKNVVHRDLTPSNIMISAVSRPAGFKQHATPSRAHIAHRPNRVPPQSRTAHIAHRPNRAPPPPLAVSLNEPVVEGAEGRRTF